MIDVTSAIYTKLSGDATLVALLATYSGSPAIFVGEPIPEDAPLPFLSIGHAVTDVPNDTVDQRGREIEQDIRGFALADGDHKLIDDIMERVRTLLHKQDLTAGLLTAVAVEVSGPVPAPVDDASLYGRVLTPRFLLAD